MTPTSKPEPVLLTGSTAAYVERDMLREEVVRLGAELALSEARNGQLRAESVARLTERRVETEAVAAERDRLIDALVFHVPSGDENYEEGDPEWRATFCLPYQPEFEDFGTRDEAVAAVRRRYGLDDISGRSS